MKNKKEIVESLKGNISWENWENEEGGHFTVNEVLNNRIEWLKESFFIKAHDLESLDTLEMLQQMLELVDIENLPETYTTKEMEKAFIAGGKLCRNIKNDSFDEFIRKLKK